MREEGSHHIVVADRNIREEEDDGPPPLDLEEDTALVVNRKQHETREMVMNVIAVTIVFGAAMLWIASILPVQVFFIILVFTFCLRIFGKTGISGL